MPFEEPLAFKVEWFDATSGLHRQFNLSFYESDKSVEMFDIKSRKMFLRRCAVSALEKKDLFLGNTIVIFSRHLLIKEFTNDYTRDKVENDKQTTLILIYPEAHSQIGHIFDSFERAGYNFVRIRSLNFTQVSAREFLDRFFVKGVDITDEVRRLTNPNHPSVALEIVGPSIITKWQTCLRPSVEFANDLQHENQELNFRGVYGSKNLAEAEWELNFIFNTKNIQVQPSPHPKLNHGMPDISCCVIKPHILREAKVGRIIEEIQTRGFDIFGLQAFILSKKEVEDFYEIYKGLANRDYAGMVKQGASGRCIVLAISKGPNLTLTQEIPSVVEAFRKVCGTAAEPEICRVLYPDSLRAKYGGMSQEENAVHCSDLEEDGLLEVEYFFTLMQPYQ